MTLVAAAPGRLPGSLLVSGRPTVDERRGLSVTRCTGKTGGDCNRPRASARSNVAQRCLHGSPCGLKYGTSARGQQLRTPHAQPHPVFRGSSHLGDDLAGPGRHDGNPTLDKIRLASRPDRIAKIPRNFLGNPHHLFPLGTDPAIGLASNSWLVTEVTMAREPAE